MEASCMHTSAQRDLVHDLLLPTVLFASLGAMTWAVRGCSGFGALAGCVFAGLLWGTAWWFIAREPRAAQPRRYASGWIILAVTVGMGLSGARGWAQWSTMFQGRLQTHTEAGEWVAISPVYGFIWLFIAGAPWAGLGACMLAWCGEGRPTRAWQWALRIGLGCGMAYLLVFLFHQFPQYFLPLYREIEDKYRDLPNNNNLRRLINDNRAALMHLGFYLGFLLFEILRRDGKNVLLILTVGVLNGLGWSLLQNWTWAESLFPFPFNWWRCWESSGGISIGIAYGVAYYLVNRPRTNAEVAEVPARLAQGRINGEWLATWLGLVAAAAPFMLGAFGRCALPALLLLAATGIAYYVVQRNRQEDRDLLEGHAVPPEDPNLERWAVYVAVAGGLCLNLKNGLKGWANLYLGNEDYWSRVLWNVLGPVALALLVWFALQLVLRPLPRRFLGNAFPRAYALVWLVLIVQNVIAQLVTGPHQSWHETAFSVYYLVLFAISGAIFHHYHRRKQYT